MIEDRRAGRAGPPHTAILAAVVALVMLVPALIGGQGEAVTEFISELLSPVGLLLLPIGLLLTIHFLSSDTGAFIAGIFSSADANSIHRASGSSVGVVMFLLLVLLLLYSRVSIFSRDDVPE